MQDVSAVYLIIAGVQMFVHLSPARKIYVCAVATVRPEHIQRILNRMKREGDSGGYIENTRQTMNMMFRQACVNGIIASNPVERTVMPKVEIAEGNPHRRAFTGHEQKRFLECAARRKPFYVDIFYVGFSTGMRVGDEHVIIRLKLGKPSKYAGLS